MSIVRTEKTGNYSVICNKLLRRKDISARAKGLFAYFMTLPDDWQVRLVEVKEHFTDGRDALRTAFKELEDAGYVERVPLRTSGGKLNGWDFIIHESTVSLETRQTVNPSDGESVTTNNLVKLNTNNTNICTDGEYVITNNKDNIHPPKQFSKSVTKLISCVKFKKAWSMFGRTGSKVQSFNYWKTIPEEDQDLIIQAIPSYLRVVSAGRRKKDFQGWINPKNRLWDQDWGSSLMEWTKDEKKTQAWGTQAKSTGIKLEDL